jgi:hypothetical protein
MVRRSYEPRTTSPPTPSSYSEKVLKAAGVCGHGAMPLHVLVQAAHVTHEFVAGAQVEVIGVAQHEGGVDVLEMFGGEEVAVGCGENAYAGALVACRDDELEHK